VISDIYDFVCVCVSALLQLLQPFYGSLDFVQDNPIEPAPEDTFTAF